MAKTIETTLADDAAPGDVPDSVVDRIREILDAPPPGRPMAPRRARADRQEVVAQQWIAPYNGRDFPAEEAFREALCLNISRSGIAMVLTVRPDWKNAVVGLNLGDQVKYMAATVVRKAPIQFDGRAHYVVGLRFNGALAPPKWWSL